MRKVACTETLVATAREVSTLLWHGDELVDVTTRLRVRADGSVSDVTMVMGFPFNRAVGMRHRGVHWAVAYANRGTKAILMRDGSIVREMNRSYYFAHTYDYPVALGVGPSGRVIVAHCPDEFDVLVVEEVESGARLAERKTDHMEFHSRLAMSPSGKHLIDAGWFWHPVGEAWLTSVETLINGKDGGLSLFSGAEIENAVFLDDAHVVATTGKEVCDDTPPPSGLGPDMLGVWSIADATWCTRVAIESPIGNVMPWRDLLICFYEHPKAIEIATGKVIHRWEHIRSGTQSGCIDLGYPPPPVMALDPVHGRFAVAGPQGITIVRLHA